MPFIGNYKNWSSKKKGAVIGASIGIVLGIIGNYLLLYASLKPNIEVVIYFISPLAILLALAFYPITAAWGFLFIAIIEWTFLGLLVGYLMDLKSRFLKTTLVIVVILFAFFVRLLMAYLFYGVKFV